MYCSYPNVPKSFVKWAKNSFGSDTDKIDVNAHYDKTLTVSENQTSFKQQFSSYFKDEVKKLAEAKEELELINRQAQESYLERRFGIELKFVMG